MESTPDHIHNYNWRVLSSIHRSRCHLACIQGNIGASVLVQDFLEVEVEKLAVKVSQSG